MSKFNRVNQNEKFVRVAQLPNFLTQGTPANSEPIKGESPVDLNALLPKQPEKFGPKLPEKFGPTPPKANPNNLFAQAGIVPSQYVGSAEDNEKLRVQLNKRLNVNYPTFYEAYIKAFGKWDNHPEKRINNLVGATQASSTPVAPITQSPQANNAQTKKFDFLPSNPPNYNKLLNTTDPFSGINVSEK